MPLRTRSLLALPFLLTALLLGGFAAFVSAAGDAGRPFSPAGLTIYLLVTDPTAPGTVYLSVGAGLFKSTDGGRTWYWSGRGLERAGVAALLADPSRPGTLYALGGGYSADLFSSTDGGASWRRLTSPPLEDIQPLGRGLAIDRSGKIYAALGHALASFNRAGTWTLIRDFNAPIQSLAVDSTAPGALYVATSSVVGGVSIPAQLHKTEDGGRTWKDISGDILPPALGQRTGFGMVFLGVAATHPATVYAGVSGQGIFQSTNGGASWRRLSLGQSIDYMALKALTLDAADPATLYAAYGGASSREPDHVAVSHDAGATWRNRDHGRTTTAVRLLAADSSGVLFAADLFGGLQLSTKGCPWRNLIRNHAGGLAGGIFPQGKVRFRPGSPSTVYTLLAGQNWKSIDGGKAWTAFAASPGSPSLNDLAFDPADPGLLYGAAGTGVFRSNDGGASWVRLREAAVNTLALPQPGTILAGGCGIVRSTDGGTTWQEVLSCQGASPSDRREIERLRINPAVPNEIFATVLSFGARSTYTSQDGGTTWRLVPGTNVLIPDPSHPRTLYAARGNDLARSTDGGGTWSTIGSFESIGEVADLVVDPARPDTFYVVTLGSLLRSQDAGKTWETPSQLPLFNIATLIPHPTTPHLFYAGGSNGVYEVRLEP